MSRSKYTYLLIPLIMRRNIILFVLLIAGCSLSSSQRIQQMQPSIDVNTTLSSTTVNSASTTTTEQQLTSKIIASTPITPSVDYSAVSSHSSGTDQTTTTNHDVIDKNISSIYRVAMRTNKTLHTMGTAFLYRFNQKSFILSAAHTFAGIDFKKDPIYLQHPQNTSALLKITNVAVVDTAFDLCLLWVEHMNKLEWPGATEAASVKSLIFNEVYSFNYSTLAPHVTDMPIRSDGRILHLYQTIPDSILLKMDVVFKGASGAPIFLNNNEELFIGMIVDRKLFGQHEVDSGYSGVISAISFKKINDLLSNFIGSTNRSVRVQ